MVCTLPRFGIICGRSCGSKVFARSTREISKLPSFSITGNNQGTSYVATNTEVKSTLGRDLSSGANGTQTVELIKPYTIFGEYAKQLDTRFSKSFNVGRYRLRANLDVYNILNRSNVQTLNTRLSSNNANNQWLLPTQILQARYFQFGTQIDF